MTTVNAIQSSALQSRSYFAGQTTTLAGYPLRLIRSALFWSQRLALDINGTTYVVTDSTRNYDIAQKVRLQIANYMRVCIDIPGELAAVRGIAASEPILSEAASLIMRGNYNFDLPDALLNVLDAYAIGHEGRGELLVAAFFTRARDLLVRQITKDNSFLMHQSVVLSRRWTYSLISSTKRLLVSCWIQCHRSVAPIFLRKSSGRCSGEPGYIPTT